MRIRRKLLLFGTLLQNCPFESTARSGILCKEAQDAQFFIRDGEEKRNLGNERAEAGHHPLRRAEEHSRDSAGPQARHTQNGGSGAAFLTRALSAKNIGSDAERAEQPIQRLLFDRDRSGGECQTGKPRTVRHGFGIQQLDARRADHPQSRGRTRLQCAVVPGVGFETGHGLRRGRGHDAGRKNGDLCLFCVRRERGADRDAVLCVPYASGLRCFPAAAGCRAAARQH